MACMDSLDVAISRVHFPVTSLGPGRRLGIWFQGCSIGCKGCISPDTWEIKGDEWITVPQLVHDCSHLIVEADGVTISGGEPFDQPEALSALVSSIRAIRDLHVIVYSGYPFTRLEKKYGPLLGQLDMLVSGPYVQGIGKLPLRGSLNQEIHEFTTHRMKGSHSPDRRLDLSFGQAGEVHLAGIL
jgi:anaerobic ribonucleoside-triphosphate reductase activating protein